MEKRIKPKAEYSLEINGKEIKRGSGVTVRQGVEEEAPLKKKRKIIPKADYSVEINR